MKTDGIAPILNRFILSLVIGVTAGAAFGAAWTHAASPMSTQAFRLQADFSAAPDATASEREAFTAFLESTAAKIPPRLKAILSRPILVRPASLGGRLVAPACAPAPAAPVTNDSPSPAHILGRLPGGPLTDLKHASVIEIHRAFLPIIASGPEAEPRFPCGHRTLYRTAQATVLHELGHLYDYSDRVLSPDQRAEVARCRARGPRAPESPTCAALLSVRGQISERPAFRNRVEWFNGVLTRGPKNQLLVRSPDPYEYRNLRENFAVNFEYFALDPEFACRRPALHDFYARAFEHPGALDPAQPCASFQQVRFAGSGLPVSLDPSRIFQVHYLFAGRGNEVSSRWGHAMIRLIVCSPERKEPSAECLKDTSYHVVASYRANVADLITSSLKGLTGAYPSQVFLFPLSEIVEEYTRGELRELTSYPLGLTEKQKSLFIRFVTEQYWQYSGRYYFLSNNCADEAFDALHAILPPEHPLQTWPLLTPLGLRDALLASGLADANGVRNLEAARQAGLYFPSHRLKLEQALAALREAGGPAAAHLPAEALAFFNRYDAQARAALYGNLPPSRKLAASFYLLEAQARRALNAKLQSDGAALLENPAENTPALDRVKQLQQIQLPWRQVGGDATGYTGYGVPLESELLAPDVLASRYQDYRDSLKNVGEWVRSRFPDAIGELDRIDANLRFFAAEMRKS